MGTTIAVLQAILTADTSGFTKNIQGANKDLENTKTHADNAGGGIGGFIAKALPIAAVAGGIAVVGGALVSCVQAAMDSQQAIAGTNAVLQSTHGISGQTSDSVQKLADKYADLVGVDDDVVRSGENMLLTFTNIRGKAFEGGTKAALDMATALNNGVAPSAEQVAAQSMQLGKALNDPLKGMGALAKIGVTFTDQQKKSIETMMKHGDIAGAQGVILKELGTEFGKAGEAAGGTMAGKMGRLNKQMGDVQKSVGNAIIPVLSKLVDAAAPVITVIGNIVTFLTSAGPAADTVRIGLAAFAVVILAALVPAFITWAAATWAVVAPMLIAAAPIIAIAAGIALLVVGIKLLIDHWGAVSQFFGNVGKAIGDFVSGALKKVGDFIGGVIKFFQDLPGKVWGFITGFVVGLMLRIGQMELDGLKKIGEFIAGILKFFADLPGKIWGFISSFVGGLVSRFIDMEVRGLLVIARMILGVIGFFAGLPGKAWNELLNLDRKILDFFGGLKDKMLNFGKSIIQRLIDGIKSMAGAVGGAISSVFGGLHLPGFASGGVAPGGLAMVGENGPEVVALPAGARVYPTGTGPTAGGGSASGASAGGASGGQAAHFHIHIAGHEVGDILMPDIVAELRRQNGTRR